MTTVVVVVSTISNSSTLRRRSATSANASSSSSSSSSRGGGGGGVIKYGDNNVVERRARRRRDATTTSASSFVRGFRRRKSSAATFAAARSRDDDDDDDEQDASSASSSDKSGGKSAYRPVWENDIDAEFRRKERFEREKKREREKEETSGLGFGRVAMMNDLSVDIGAQVKEIEERKKKEEAEKTKSGKKLNALDLATTDKGDSKYNLDGWNYAPTKAERSRWANEWAKAERAKAAKNPSYRPMSRQMLNRTIKDSDWKMRNDADKKAQETPTEVQMRRRKEDQARLEQSKRDLFMGTLGLCVAGGFGAVFAGSNSSVLASWALGSFGSLLYVRLLSQKADSQGGQGGPPTILVPVILFMALNRFNALGGAEATGVTLTPIPMLLAFFSYKPASLFQGLRDLVESENENTYSE